MQFFLEAADWERMAIMPHTEEPYEVSSSNKMELFQIHIRILLVMSFFENAGLNYAIKILLPFDLILKRKNIDLSWPKNFNLKLIK